MELYGNFGLSLYTKIKYIKLPVDPEAFLKNVIEYYFNEKYYENTENIEKFINNLPKLEKISEIIHKKMFNDKDILPLKCVFDLYENYYKNETFNYEVIIVH